MSNMRRAATALSLLLFSAFFHLAAQQRLSDADVQLVAETARHAADVETITALCSTKNPRAATQYQAAFTAWQQRNHWEALKRGSVAHDLAEGEYEQLKAASAQDLQRHSFKSALACGNLPQLMRLRENDPSVQHGQDLARIAGSEAPAVAPPVTPAHEPPAYEQPEPPVTAQVQPRPAEQTPAPAPPEASSPLTGGNTVGSIDFTPPPGWAPLKNSPGLVAFSRGAKYGGKFIIYLSSTQITGDFRQAFDSAVRASFPGTRLELKYVNPAKTASGLPAYTVRDSGRLRNGSFASIRAAGISLPGNHLQLAVLLSTAGVGDLIDAEKAFDAFVTSFRIRDVPASTTWTPLHPPAGSGGQSALYFGAQLQNVLNPLGGMDLQSIRHYVILLPNGQAYDDLPNDGHVLDMDFAAACRKTPKKCGTYRIQGATIHFTWYGDYGFITEESTAYQRSKDGRPFFDHDGASLVRVEPVHGLHLSGRFTSTFYMSGNTATSSTGITSQTFIAFTPQGGYQKSGFASATFSNSGAGGTTMGRKGLQTGSYTIDGYTLTLVPQTGGPPELFSIVFEDPSPSPKAVFINDSAFLNDARR